jgi:hypothetical protein
MPLLISWFWTWVKKKMIHPSSLEDRSSTLPTQSFTSDSDKSISNSLEKRYAAILIVIPLMSRLRSPTPEGGADHPNTGGINSQGMDGKKMKNLKNL